MEDKRHWVLEDMDVVRTFCRLIKQGREKAGFQSLKYPLTDVVINHYLLPEFRQLIADECNIAGYMDMLPVEYDWNAPQGNYLLIEEGELKVWISTTRSSWQQEMADERIKKREEAESRKVLSELVK